ncbi:flavin-dependent quinone reductase NDAI_0G06280 [Naumovozyma dairenensis CBS 421]|uniref:NADPH-dependent FMN reductase-like domain-containing protein n=1 Tax=Naumovozyma dairenensis (strain ATCC 10597 / BCRC 20456 / CBS 421 / NBRC 0211 / NRRL Y-12639) TaxID=1071378 RepID=J7S4S3_NAUDC|nr:hypothetical protein NDAI_0G06280 [Naumovozyma dairenensis CBS 421]CCK73611.1 hypothetical protein NDAI_0G06280 [Naumovozyma dairenensis CBS 421]
MSVVAKKIGVIMGSTRNPRACPLFTNFIIDIIKTTNPSAILDKKNKVSLEIVDLNDFALPMLNETIPPLLIKNSSNYDHSHTKKWSEKISTFDGFIIVSPQYNWGYPAVLKNAIDYLCHEWFEKPVMIVTYGGYGGNKCNEQLTQVLRDGLRMKVTDKTVMLKFPSREFALEVVSDKYMSKSFLSEGLFSEYKDDVVSAFDELVEKL